MTADYNGWNDLPEAEREALNEADEQMTSAPRARKPWRSPMKSRSPVK